MFKVEPGYLPLTINLDCIFVFNGRELKYLQVVAQLILSKQLLQTIFGLFILAEYLIYIKFMLLPNIITKLAELQNHCYSVTFSLWLFVALFPNVKLEASLLTQMSIQH